MSGILKRYYKLSTTITLLMALWVQVPLFAQEGDGGLQNPLHELGAGARALSLGRAYVALADDPTAVFWNPAGLEYVPRVAFSLYYSQLALSGVSYDFVGFVYPTLQFGSVGVGFSRIGVGEINATDVSGAIVSENNSFDYSEIYIGYAKRLFWGITPGFTFKVHRQSLSFEGRNNSAFGLDGGLMYRPEADEGILGNLSVGFHYQNLIKPELNFSQNSDTLSGRLSFGIMKGIPVGLSGRLNLLLSYDQVKNEGGSFHTGAEYRFSNLANLRVGFDRDAPSFGAGLTYKFVDIDYAFGNPSTDNAFSAQHRFSITFNLGKSRQEKVFLAEKARMERERELVDNTKLAEKQRRIAEGMSKGKEYLDTGRYFEASVEFQRVISEDPFNRTAQALFDSAQTAIELEFQKGQEQAVALALDKEKETQNQKLIDLYFERGRNYLQNKQYTDALIQFRQALELRPDDPVLKNAVSTTERQLNEEIKSLVDNARRQFQQGNYSEALQVLSEALILAPDTQTPETTALKNEINTLKNRIQIQQYIIDGLALLKVGNLQRALDVLKQALALDPTNKEVRQYVEQTELELRGGQQQKMDPESELQFIEGTDHFLAGRYEKALEIFTKLAKKYPYNKRLQDAIKTTEDRIKHSRGK